MKLAAERERLEGKAQEYPKKRLRFLLKPRPTPDQLERLRSAITVSFVPMDAIGENGEIDTSQTREKEDVSFGYTQFFDGDVLVAKITPCFENGKGGLVRNLLGGVGFGTTELHVLRPGPSLDARFLSFVVSSRPFRKLGEGSMIGAAGQKRVPEEFVNDYVLAVPSVSQQGRIAAWLDKETKRVDALVLAKQRLLDLLAEKRQSLTTHAITRGIDPSVRFRSSNIPWLGDIPTHWRAQRTRWLFEERDERTEGDEGEMLTVSHLTGVTPRSEKDVNMFEAETTSGYKLCRKGDLAINTLWAWMGAMGVSPCDGIVSPAYNVYEPGAEMDGGYVDALVRLPKFAQEVIRYSKGVWSSRLRLYPEGFFEAWMPVPPLDEQRSIVAYIAAETRKLDALRASAEQTIALLRERRAALIAAAVTGQLAVDR